MQADERQASGLVARAANRHLGKADREAAGVLSSAQRHTHFLDSPRLAQAMDGADFSFTDLRRENATIYLVLPPDRLDAYGRWLRLLVSQALGELGRHQTPLPSPAAASRTRPPVLFLLDEFAALGRLEAVERAMGLMAGLGVQLWPMLQDLHQLRALYGKRAETFLANAGVIQVFGTNDVETASWVSRTLGSRTARYETSGTSSSSSSSGLAGPVSTTVGRSTGSHLTGRPLLTPDEVLRLPAGQQILLRVGQAPARAAKIRYYEEQEFTSMLR